MASTKRSKAKKQASRESAPAPRMPRVVFTGGPAAGKTAVLDVLRRHLAGGVAVLPEAATILFTGGFPRPKDVAGRRHVQQAIFQVQRSIEGIYGIEHPDVPHICDRGGLDGAAYWPGGLSRFLGAMGTTLDSEYRRYDAVIFMETSAYDEHAYPAENPYRTETPAQARKIDRTLREIWEGHPQFFLVGREVKFYEKVASCMLALSQVLDLGELNGRKARKARAARQSP
ncbi:MAG: ATP-binding protein [Myxococcales bacterium]|nr:ATP-binding protein [Myxococcales bacterium]